MRAVAAPDFRTLRGLLADEIARLRAEDPLRPVEVVTPSDVGREETRRDLAARGRGILGIRVRSFSEWIAALARPQAARAGRRHLPEPGFERLVSRIVEESFPPSGTRRNAARRSGPASAPGWARALADTIARLLRGGYSAEILARAWPVPPDPARADLLALFRELEQRVAEERLVDRGLEETLAARALHDARPGSEPTPLLLFGFHDLTPRQRAVVAAAARVRPVGVLVPGPGGAGSAAAAPLLDWLREQGGTPEFFDRCTGTLLTLGEGLFREAALEDPGPERLELVTFPNDAAEVRGIARRIRHEVAEHGRPLDDFLVTVPTGGPSPLLFRRIFAKAGVPLADRAGIPASRTLPGSRAMILARALAAGPGNREWETLDFLSPGAPGDAARGADLSRRFARARDWRDAAARFRELHELRFGEAVPPEIDPALECLAVVYGPRRVRPREFVRALGAALGDMVHRDTVAAGDGGDSVLLLRMEAARGVERAVVFHAGLAEGAVRRLPREDPLLPDRLREELNARFEHRGLRLPLREESRVEKVLLARFAFESAREKAVLSWAIRRRTGSEARNPSGILLDLASHRAGEPLDPTSRGFLAVVPAVRPQGRDEPVDRTDLDLALLLGTKPPGRKELARLLAEDRARRLPRLLRAAERRWRAGELTEHDGILRDGRAIRAAWRRVDPREHTWSPTALESLANCPFSFLIDRVLGLEGRAEPGEDFDPRDRGEIFHGILETLYADLRDEGLLPLTPDRLGTALGRLQDRIDARRAALAREPAAHRAHRAASLASMRHDLAILLARDAHLPAASRPVPTHFEYAFGRGDPANAPHFDLGEGRALPLRGVADRVDVRPDGAIEIVDLKTGRPRSPTGSITGPENGRTTVRLQLPLYLHAVSRALGRPPGRALFYHATAEHGFREIEFTAADLERARPRLRGLFRHLLDRAARGWFPCVPGKACCRGDLARACGPAVTARFHRKVSDAALREHLRLLAEPDGGDEA